MSSVVITAATAVYTCQGRSMHRAELRTGRVASVVTRLFTRNCSICVRAVVCMWSVYANMTLNDRARSHPKDARTCARMMYRRGGKISSGCWTTGPCHTPRTSTSHRMTSRSRSRCSKVLSLSPSLPLSVYRECFMCTCVCFYTLYTQTHANMERE